MNCRYGKARGRQGGWDYAKALRWNERIQVKGQSYLYTWELSGPCGAHYHVWLPPDTPDALHPSILSALRDSFDVVSWSWDYIPDDA